MMKLSQIVSEIKNRTSILEDENLFLRTEFQRISRANIQLCRQNGWLESRLKNAMSGGGPTPTEMKSTKLTTVSGGNSSNGADYQAMTDGGKEDYFKRSLTGHVAQTIYHHQNTVDIKTKQSPPIPFTSQFSINL